MKNRRFFLILILMFFGLVVFGAEKALAAACVDGWHCQRSRAVRPVIRCDLNDRGRCYEVVWGFFRVWCNNVATCSTTFTSDRCKSTVPAEGEDPCPENRVTERVYCCVEDEEDPPCNPSCSPACGQNNGCGGTCSNSASGIPDAPTLTSPVGGSVTIDVGEDVVVSWDPVNKADLYEYEIYQVGEDCSHATKHCGSQVGTSVSFPALVTDYYYLVRAVNTSCGFESSGDTTGTFTVNGLVSGQVLVLDDGASAGEVGGFCSLLGGTASGSDAGGGSSVSVDAGGSGGGVAGDGTYSVVDVPTGLGYIASLTIGDPANYSCECPSGCSQGAVSSPQAGVNFYLTNFKEAWFQVEGGNLHADSGNVSSPIPDTCSGVCEPYLIVEDAGGATGAVSYTGTYEIGDGDGVGEDGSDWTLNTEYKGQQTGYGYFNRILEEDPAGVESWGGDKPNDLVIDVNIDVAVGGFLAIISSGNISIGDEVTNIEGVYIADGIIATCESFECGNSEGSGDVTDEQLIVEGILVGWGGVDLRRNFASSDSNLYPTELFIYRPDLQVNAYQYLLRSHYTWEEKAP